MLDQKETEKIVSHLRRLEGQIRGVAGMIYKQQPVEKVIVQLKAARSSMDSVTSAYLSSQIKCEPNGQCLLSEKMVDVILREIKK
ncbi:MAG: metal-sensing transcriptional repressor [Candidatus Berkelbacteria bacterium]